MLIKNNLSGSKRSDKIMYDLFQLITSHTMLISSFGKYARAHALLLEI